MAKAAKSGGEGNEVTPEQGQQVQLVLEAMVASGAAGGGWVELSAH